ncbi:Spy/CpxP family protein refolding chaperone [Pusillimonas minor]|uniref:Periplasmic heavy metal sensor n=1 Tax=Pusillimonas minor TaxID=2697024 RepID=A0A842HN66_9BURK|nr:hypothetical protein [Pusillimonas minor]MBC2769344.1 hypothetical protein [Pusillimonas minor]
MARQSSVVASALAAVVASVALHAPVLAAPPAGDQAPVAAEGKRGHYHHDRKGNRMAHAQSGMVVPGYGVISQQQLDTLALTDAQKALVSEARDAQKAAWSAHRTDMQAQRTAQLDALKAGKADPRAQVKAMADRQAQMMQARTTITDKWLAVWDALDDAQRQKVSTLLAERAQLKQERLGQRMQRGPAS